MIEAHKVSAWKGRYDIVADGRPVATWDKSAWTSGAGSRSTGSPTKSGPTCGGATGR